MLLKAKDEMKNRFYYLVFMRYNTKKGGNIMKYKNDFLKEFELLKLPTKGGKKITDPERVSELHDLIYQNKTLPENIDFELKGRKRISDDLKFREMKNLPHFITKGEEIIEDQEEIQSINDYFHQNYGTLPENITTYEDKLDGEFKIIYCKKDTEAYYISEYSFYEEYILSDQELEFELKVKNARSLSDMASSLVFFQTLAVIGLVITGILLILYIISLF